MPLPPSDSALEGRECPVGAFSAADGMLSHALFMANLKGYVRRIEERPAFQTAINM